MKMIFLFMMGILLPARYAIAQVTKPIYTIGDTIPDLQIHYTVNNHPLTNKLSDFKGKAIILDFWETWCSGCIHKLFRYQQLQKEFDKDLQLITLTHVANAAQVKENLQRYQKEGTMSLPVIAADTVLYQWFPHEVVSHLVWIDSHSVVRAITDGELVDSAHIAAFLQQPVVHWPVKTN